MKRPRGTRDFNPEAMHVRRWAQQQMRGVFDRHGFGEVQTPTFEELELFTAKSGENIRKELYDFQDKGGRELALRPELTAPTMRMYFGDHQFDPKPIKWSYFQSCFRYDRPQSGRYREFYQYGCELIGSDEPVAYAEIMAVAMGCFAAIGLTEVELRVGHVGVLKQFVDATGLSGEARAELMRAIDKQDGNAVARALQSVDGAAARALEGLLQVRDVDQVPDAVPEATRAALTSTFQCLEALGVQATLDLGIARGLDYYTGIVFEGHIEALGAEKQVLGGGGYDLSQVFGAQPTPTIGFGLGFDRALVALERVGIAAPPVPGPALVLGALGSAQPHALRLAASLRGEGFVVEVDLMDRKIGKLAQWASTRNATWFAVLGDRDLEQGTLNLKQLATGEEVSVPLDAVATILAS